jgi:TolB-like protein
MTNTAKSFRAAFATLGLFACLGALAAQAVPDNAVILSVMPFKSTADAAPLNLGDSFSETITTKLVGLRGLKVYERTQFDKVRGELNFQRDASDLVDQESVVKVGSVVSMDYMILGSVTLAGSRIGTQIRLVKVRDGQALLSKLYEGQYPKGIFAMQDEIALDLVGALKIKLDDLDKRKLTKPVTENFDSWQLYNRSLGNLARNERIALLEKALAADPSFAMAAQLLADLYLDAKAPEKAIKVYQDILARDPGDFRSLYNSALLEFDRGRLVDARELMERCQAAKDGDPDVVFHLGFFSEFNLDGERLGDGADPKAALLLYRQALALAPLHRESLLGAGMVAAILAQNEQDPAAQLGLLAESKVHLEQFLALKPDEAEAAEAENTVSQIDSIIPQLQDYLAKRNQK